MGNVLLVLEVPTPPEGSSAAERPNSKTTDLRLLAEGCGD